MRLRRVHRTQLHRYISILNTFKEDTNTLRAAHGSVAASSKESESGMPTSPNAGKTRYLIRTVRNGKRTGLNDCTHCVNTPSQPPPNAELMTARDVGRPAAASARTLSLLQPGAHQSGAAV